MQRTDTELLAAFTRDADAEAFTRLVERHVDIVYAAAHRQARGAASRMTSHMTVFLILLKRARTIRDGRLLAAWLLNVTNYCAKDALKSERRRKAREAEVAKAVANDDRTDAHTRHELEMAGLLDEGLAALPPIDRQAVVQRYWKNQPLAKVGSTLGISEEAARKRLTRAVEKLRKFFAKRGIKVEATIVTGALTNTARANAPDNVKSACIALAFKSALIATGGNSAPQCKEPSWPWQKFRKSPPPRLPPQSSARAARPAEVRTPRPPRPSPEPPAVAQVQVTARRCPDPSHPRALQTIGAEIAKVDPLPLIDAPHVGDLVGFYILGACGTTERLRPYRPARHRRKPAVVAVSPNGAADLVVALIRRSRATETTAWEGIGGVLTGFEAGPRRSAERRAECHPPARSIL